MKHISALVGLTLAFSACSPAHAEVDPQTVRAFLEAQRLATLHGTENTIGDYVAFMSEEMVDRHISYGVEFSGTSTFRENLPSKAAGIDALEYEVKEITVRQDLALLDYVGTSTASNANGDPEISSTRWLIVLDFDENGRVEKMTRYSVPDFTR